MEGYEKEGRDEGRNGKGGMEGWRRKVRKEIEI